MLVIDVRNLVGLGGEPILSKLLVNDALGLEGGPGRLTVLMGRAGSGKTVLGWSMYYAPVVVAQRLLRATGRTGAAKLLSFLMDMVAGLTGTAAVRWSLEGDAEAYLCRPGTEVLELEDLGYSPEAVSRVCIGIRSGGLVLKLVTSSGRVYFEDVSRGTSVAGRVLLQGVLTYPLPSHLRWSLYSLRASDVDSLCRLAEDARGVIEELEGLDQELVRMLVLTRLPPVEFQAVDAVAEDKLECAIPLYEVDETLGLHSLVRVKVRARGTENVEAYTTLSHGEP